MALEVPSPRSGALVSDEDGGTSDDDVWRVDHTVSREAERERRESVSR